MTEHPGDVLDEAVKLFAALRGRMGATAGGGGHGGAGRGGGDRDAGGDAWNRATAPEPRPATGAPECRDCPVCRAIALARESGPDVARHVREAGRSLAAAAFDVAVAFERARARGGPSDGTGGGTDGTGGGTGQRPGSGGAWASATGEDPIDIG